MRLTPILYLFLLAYFPVVAQESITISKTLNWKKTPIVHNPTGRQASEIWSFDGALFGAIGSTVPIFMERFPLPESMSMRVRVIDATFDMLPASPTLEAANLPEELDIQTIVEEERSRHFGKLFFTPIIKEGSQYKKLTSVNLQIDLIPDKLLKSKSRGPEYASSSVLSTGQIFKIAVAETGIHRLTYDFLKEELKMDIDQIDPRTIRLLGNGGGILPESISADRYDDLTENAIQVIGEEDGRFDPSDYILFYGNGPHQWHFDAEQNRFERTTNIYDQNNYYFILVDGTSGLRIANQNSLTTTTYSSRAFDDYIRYEEDKVNLLDAFSSTQGTGKNWYGDLFETIRDRTYNEFSFPNILTDELAHIQVAFAGRSSSRTNYAVTVANNTYNASIRNAHTGDIEARYAYVGIIDEAFQPNDATLPVAIEYPLTSSSTGWLDYIEINARRRLIYEGAQLAFRDHQTLDFASSTYLLSGTNNNTLVWDVSNPLSPKNQLFDLQNDGLAFGTSTTTLKEFIAFDANGPFLESMAIGEVSNQNLHTINRADLVIIYPTAFEDAAMRLAEHRRTHNGYTVQTVLIDQIFNEFSSGRQDPTAIRDFTKMIYDRDPQFRYLLLLGDGSFDFKNIKRLENPSGFIPVYETEESLHPIDGFPSDDYFALLSDNEGANLKGALDIAVGRIPVKSSSEAQVIIDKIINYDTNPATLGDWRLRQAYVADDEDSSIHQRQADQIATRVDTTYDVFNVNKIFLDAYQQVTTPGGQRYPAAKEAINNDIFKGLLVINYMGHGGARGWTQERVLETNDILSWTNINQLPLFVTATCSFTGYDDPNFVTAGEEVFLNPSGGGIALFTTVRAVYSSSNERLTKAVFNQLFEPVNGEHPPIGELMRLAKNSNASDTTSINARKFTLIGDPSMELALPRYNVVTDKVDNQNITINQIDTIRALQRVTLEGFIADNNNQIVSSFNGTIYPTVFDKRTQVSNLGQDAGSRVLSFDIQKNVLFKGKATVKDGRFSFTFVVPKDINYEFGRGKVSYYAENGIVDAAGYYDNLIIGGTNTDAANDSEGPVVQVFMNDSTFVFGGSTGPDPTLLVFLSDDNGINVSGTSIGHDLTAVLDNNTQNTFQLNDFYESKLDDYKTGTVRYPLKDIPIGMHQIKVKAWDVFNNSTEAITEFVVDASIEGSLERILNYPNPFTTNTEFQFLHNLGAEQLLDVQIRIFTVSGRLVKTIDTQVASQGNRVSGIQWDGRDTYGGDLARGVYLYRISVRPVTTSGEVVNSDFEKLVILK